MKNNGSCIQTRRVVGVFLAVILNTTKLASDLENNVRISTFLKLNVHDGEKEIADPNDKSKMITNPDYHKIEKAIEKVPHVTKEIGRAHV